MFRHIILFSKNCIPLTFLVLSKDKIQKKKVTVYGSYRFVIALTVINCDVFSIAQRDLKRIFNLYQMKQ